MPPRRTSSIAIKLTWMNMLVSGVALLVSCAAFVVYDRVTFRETMVQGLSTQAQIIGANSVSAILFDDPDAAGKTLSAVRADPDIISAGIRAPDGRVFAAYPPGSGAGASNLPAILPKQGEGYGFRNGELALVRTIAADGRPIGLVYLRSNLRQLDVRLRRYASIGGLVLGTSLAAALVISWMSQRAISRPVAHLAETSRIVSRDQNYSLRATPTGNSDEIAELIDDFNEMLAQIQQRDAALQTARDEMEQRVQHRTAELSAANGELEAFSYSVSHDLRAPLRSIDGFSNILLEDYSEALDEAGREHLRRVRLATQRMSVLIDDLLKLSKVTRAAMVRERLDLSALARAVADETQRAEPHRPVEFVIGPGLVSEGDPGLMRVVMENLLGNAWKYTSSHPRARIEFGAHRGNGRPAFFVRDDGAGFDAAYAGRLFGAFQRLHAESEFPGTGIGLATVQRIIRRHGGEVWAEGEIEKGATFYFSL
jgi:signal transduction histidine kinase